MSLNNLSNSTGIRANHFNVGRVILFEEWMYCLQFHKINTHLYLSLNSLNIFCKELAPIIEVITFSCTSNDVAYNINWMS